MWRNPASAKSKYCEGPTAYSTALTDFQESSTCQRGVALLRCRNSFTQAMAGIFLRCTMKHHSGEPIASSIIFQNFHASTLATVSRTARFTTVHMQEILAGRQPLLHNCASLRDLRKL